jgi:hypothetical protein
MCRRIFYTANFVPLRDRLQGVSNFIMRDNCFEYEQRPSRHPEVNTHALLFYYRLYHMLKPAIHCPKLNLEGKQQASVNGWYEAACCAVPRTALRRTTRSWLLSDCYHIPPSSRAFVVNNMNKTTDYFQDGSHAQETGFINMETTVSSINTVILDCSSHRYMKRLLRSCCNTKLGRTVSCNSFRCESCRGGTCCTATSKGTEIWSLISELIGVLFCQPLSNYTHQALKRDGFILQKDRNVSSTRNSLAIHVPYMTVMVFTWSTHITVRYHLTSKSLPPQKGHSLFVWWRDGLWTEEQFLLRPDSKTLFAWICPRLQQHRQTAPYGERTLP